MAADVKTEQQISQQVTKTREAVLGTIDASEQQKDTFIDGGIDFNC
ncbi:MAG: hypothetical protein ACJARW_000449 [Methylophilaceae bacterium]|jgi:hypothetical protein|tara:strand:- start:5377 stop:5514 length:138 start_codon:yes stop_codon:yes gene_type:complete